VDVESINHLESILPGLENVVVSFARETEEGEGSLKTFMMVFPGFLCSSGHSNVEGAFKLREIRLIVGEGKLSSYSTEELSTDGVLYVTKGEVSLEEIPSGCNVLMGVDADLFSQFEESGVLIREEEEEEEVVREESMDTDIKRIQVDADFFSCGMLRGIVFQTKKDEMDHKKLSMIVGNGREEIQKRIKSLLVLIVSECYAHLSSVMWLRTLFGDESHPQVRLPYASLLLGRSDEEGGPAPSLDLKTLRSLCELRILKTQTITEESGSVDADASVDKPFEVWWLLYYGDGDVSVHDYFQSIATQKQGKHRFYSKETCVTVSMEEHTRDDASLESDSHEESSSHDDGQHPFFIASSSLERPPHPLSDALMRSSFGRLLCTLFSCAKHGNIRIEIEHSGWNDRDLVMEFSPFRPYSVSCPWDLAPERALELGRASYDRYLSHLQGIGDQLIEETFSVLQQLMMQSSRLGAEFAETLGALAQTLVDQEKHFKGSVKKLVEAEVFQGFDALDSFGREIVRFVLTWNKTVQTFVENYGSVEEGALLTSTMSDDASQFDENLSTPIVGTFDEVSLSKKKSTSSTKKKSPFLEESKACVVKLTVGKDKLNLKLIAIPSSFLPDHSTRKMYTDLPSLRDKEEIVPIIFDDELGSFVSYFLLSSEYLSGLTIITGDEDIARILIGEKGDDADDSVSIKTSSDFLISTDFRHMRMSFFDSIVRESVDICAYFPHQFAALRHFILGKEKMFVQSLCRSSLSSHHSDDDDDDVDDALSRSLTWNEMFLIREVSEEKAVDFCEVAGTYFAYMSKIMSQKYESIMSKIVGMYCVNTASHERPRYFFVMENNLCTHVHDERGEVFVLHGDQFCDDGIGGSYVDVEVCGMNANTLRDQDVLDRVMTGEPFIVDGRSWDFLKMAVWNDSLFLSSMQMMDYAVVLSVMEERRKYIVSIVDHTSRYKASRHFDYWTKSEDSRRKKVRRIHHPSEYKEVFRKAIQRYFATVPSILQ
jgi:hypothetical protein